MKRNRRLAYWILGPVVIALVIASSVGALLYSKWREDQAVIPSERVAITLVEEREEVRDGQARYVFVFDIVFPKDCECNVIAQKSGIPEDRWLARGDSPVRKPSRKARLVVTHLYDVESQTTRISHEMTSNDSKKGVLEDTDMFGPTKTKFDARPCKPKVELLSATPAAFPADLLVISTQNAAPGPSATHQMLTLIRVSGPGGSAPEVGEDVLDLIAREYRMGGVKNQQ